MVLSQRGISVALAAVAIFLGLAQSAAAKPRLSGEHRDLTRELVEAKQRVHELEERIRQIEVQLAREVREAPADEAHDSTACALPFFLDASGLKHLRPECRPVASEASCLVPFVIGEDGLKRFRAACASAP